MSSKGSSLRMRSETSFARFTMRRSKALDRLRVALPFGNHEPQEMQRFASKLPHFFHLAFGLWRQSVHVGSAVRFTALPTFAMRCRFGRSHAWRPCSCSPTDTAESGTAGALGSVHREPRSA